MKISSKVLKKTYRVGDHGKEVSGSAIWNEEWLDDCPNVSMAVQQFKENFWKQIKGSKIRQEKNHLVVESPYLSIDHDVYVPASKEKMEGWVNGSIKLWKISWMLCLMKMEAVSEEELAAEFSFGIKE